MPAGNVSVTAEFEKDPSVVIAAIAATDGTASVDKPNAEKDDIVTLTVVPESGKRVSAVTVTNTVAATEPEGDPTVKTVDVIGPIAGNAVKYAFAQGEGISNVTVSFVDETATEKYIIADQATWVAKDDETAHGGDYLLKMYTMSNKAYENPAVVRYPLTSDDIARITKAELVLTAAPADYAASGGSTEKDWQNAPLDYYVLGSDEWDASTLTHSGLSALSPASFTQSGVWTTKDQTNEEGAFSDDVFLPEDASGHGAYSTPTLDVTTVVKAQDDTAISFLLGTNTARHHYLKNAPVLKLTLGQIVTFNVVSAANTETKVSGAAISIKKDGTEVATATTVEGTASLALDPGTYTYDITEAGYANLTNQPLTVESSAVTLTPELPSRVATTVELTSPDVVAGAVGDTITYSATVKDQDARVIDGATVEWKVGTLAETVFTADTEHFSATAAGTVTINTGATDGNYKVQAKSGDAVAYADITVTSASKYALTVGAIQVNDTDAGTVAVKFNGETTSVREFVDGSAVTLVATPKIGYAFAGWAITDDATEYINGAGAEYAVTMNAAKTYYAYFTFTGVYVNDDFSSYETTAAATEDGDTVAVRAGETRSFANMSWTGANANGSFVAKKAAEVFYPSPRNVDLKDGQYLWLFQNNESNSSVTSVIQENTGITSAGTIEFDMILPTDMRSEVQASWNGASIFNATSSTTNTRHRGNDNQSISFTDGTNIVASISTAVTTSKTGGSQYPSAQDVTLTIGNEETPKTLVISTGKWMHVKIEYNNKVSTITVTPDDTAITAVSGTYTSTAETIGTINTLNWQSNTNSAWANVGIDNLQIKETTTP